MYSHLLTRILGSGICSSPQQPCSHAHVFFYNNQAWFLRAMQPAGKQAACMLHSQSINWELNANRNMHDCFLKKKTEGNGCRKCVGVQSIILISRVARNKQG